MEFEHVNEINVEELMTLHKEALAVAKNQTVLVNNILKDHKHTNLETLSIVREQVNTVQKVLEIQDSALKILSRQTPHTSITLYTAQNIPLSKTSNWIFPFGKYTDPCLICSYYGHGFRECPNICEGFLGSCLRCWGPEHDAKSCKLPKRTPPFKDGYHTPEQLIESLGTFHY